MRELITDADPAPREQQHDEVIGHQAPVLAAAQLLWCHRGFLLRASVAGLVLGTLIALLTPKHYQSTTRLMPPDSQSVGPLAMVASMAANANPKLSEVADLLPTKSTGALFLGILRSRTVRDRLVQRFDLRKVYHEKLMIDASDQLGDNTAIVEDRRGGIITLTVTDLDPRRASAIASAYVEELDRLVATLNTSAAHRERVFIENQLKQVKHDLDEASRQLSEFSSKNATIDVKEQGKAMLGAAATLQGMLIAAESESKALEQIYTSNNVRVRVARARVAELRSQLQTFRGAPEGGTAEPGQVDSTLFPSLRRLPVLGLTYVDLYRRATIQEMVYEALNKQYELAKVQEAKEIPSVRVLDVANVPEKKSGPFRLAIILVSTFFSLVLAAVWILGHSFWNRVDPQDQTKLFVRVVLKDLKPGPAFWRKNGSREHDRVPQPREET